VPSTSSECRASAARWWPLGPLRPANQFLTVRSLVPVQAATVFAGKNQFYMIGWTPGNFDITNPVRELLSMEPGAGSNNWGKYSNPKVDELRAKIAVETNAAKRQALSSELWQVVKADTPIIPLHQEPQIFGLRDTVANFTMRAQEDVELRYVRMKP
jgi:peptide/nickel transport system substrate-binding protein